MMVGEKDKTQGQKFADKARELGCDEDEAEFDEKLARLAKAKAKPKKDESE